MCRVDVYFEHSSPSKVLPTFTALVEFEFLMNLLNVYKTDIGKAIDPLAGATGSAALTSRVSYVWQVWSLVWQLV